MYTKRSASPKIHGILNVAKPAGVTSRDVVDKIARLVRPSKAGHAGTLDPLATGVLIVCVGDATRLVSDLQSQTKQYRGVFQLGCTSDTEDITGEVTPTENATAPSREEIEAALPEFVGDVLQTPPQFSAKQVQGRRAYDMARAGQTVELEPVTVHIDRITLISYDYPRLELDIECGSGTYIRSIGRDLGERLGCGAVMTELARKRIGEFDLEHALTDTDIDLPTIQNALAPLSAAVPNLPRYAAKADELPLIAQGKRLTPPADWEPPTTNRVALITPDGTLAAIAEWKPDEGRLAPRMVFWKPQPTAT